MIIIVVILVKKDKRDIRIKRIYILKLQKSHF